jgi:hypothetical protein
MKCMLFLYSCICRITMLVLRIVFNDIEWKKGCVICNGIMLITNVSKDFFSFQNYLGRHTEKPSFSYET